VSTTNEWSRSTNISSHDTPAVPQETDVTPEVTSAVSDLLCSGLERVSLTVQETIGGTTEPGPGTYTFDIGTSITVRAIPFSLYNFSQWTGQIDAGTENDNPIKMTLDSDKTISPNFIRRILAPRSFFSEQVLNRSLSQAEYINILTWQPNPNNVGIVKYRIYVVEGNIRSLLIEQDVSTLEYHHRKVIKDRTYSYQCVAVDNQGTEGEPTTFSQKGSKIKFHEIFIRTLGGHFFKR